MRPCAYQMSTVEHGPWAANSSTFCGEIMHILHIPKINIRIHKYRPFWTKWTQSTFSNLVSLRSILILHSHLRLRLSRCLFLSGLQTEIQYAFIFFPCMSHRLLNLCSWFCQRNNVWWEVRMMKLPITRFSPTSLVLSVWSSTDFWLCSSISVTEVVVTPIQSVSSYWFPAS